MSTLYAWDRWSENLRRYFGWFIDLNSPGLLLAFIAPVVVRVRFGLAMIGFFLLLLSCYLFYVVFDTWPFLRFLLPAFPLLFILASAVVERGLEWLPLTLRSAAVFLLCVLLPISYVIKADSLTAFHIRRAEHRYVAVGEHIGRALPANSVVLTMIQSGSVRLYGGRLTVRWDIVEPTRLDETLDLLQRSGYEPYLLLEDWELPLFRKRFGGASQFGDVDWPPALAYKDISYVAVYRFADRARYRAGESIQTGRIPYSQ